MWLVLFHLLLRPFPEVVNTLSRCFKGAAFAFHILIFSLPGNVLLCMLLWVGSLIVCLFVSHRWLVNRVLFIEKTTLSLPQCSGAFILNPASVCGGQVWDFPLCSFGLFVHSSAVLCCLNYTSLQSGCLQCQSSRIVSAVWPFVCPYKM